MGYELVLTEKSFVSFVGLKSLINQTTLLNEEDISLKRELRTLHIFDDNLLKDNEYSITSSTDFDDQIRFYTSSRIERIFAMIVDRLLQKEESITINIYNSNLLDAGTKWFTKYVLDRGFNISIFEINKKQKVVSNIYYNENETQINKYLKLSNINKKQFDFLIREANNYLNIGDFLTAIEIYTFLEKYDTRPFLYNQLSTAYTMKGDTVKAELYLNKWYDAGSLVDKGYACYSLSMFYARHLAKGSINNSKALEWIGYNNLYSFYKVCSKL